MRKGKVILIDGNSLLYRAFFAMPHFSTLENQPTNAVYGFTMMLLRLIQEEKPDIIMVAFDAPAKTFRHKEYEQYKAHRKPVPDELKAQAPLAREIVEAFNIPSIEVEGFEADDVIGTLARRAESDGYEVLIVTGDLDALQLVTPHVKVMTTIKGVSETVVYDEGAVIDRYGLRPSQLPDFKALKGDASDNIPGVPGIGDKTALKLIRDFGELENVIIHVNEIEPAKIRDTLTKYADLARHCKSLATIVTNVPLDVQLSDCLFSGPNYPVLRELFKQLEFRSLLKKLPQENMQGSLFADDVTSVQPQHQPRVFNSREELRLALPKLLAYPNIAIRILGNSPRGIEAQPLGVAIGTSAGETFYIPFEYTDIQLADLREVMESEKIAKYAYNLKYDIEIATRHGIRIKGPCFDVLIAAYLLNPSRGEQSLSNIAFDYAGVEIENTNDGITNPTELAANVSVIKLLVPILADRLAADGLDDIMVDIEMPLVPILADMELTGVLVDQDCLRNLSFSLARLIAELERDIYALAGCEFNIGSPRQLQDVLFKKLGLPAEKKTKTGYSTDADTLAALAPAHEIVAKILRYRELTKLKATYVDALPKLINPQTGRVHTSLNQAVTATGRLSSSDPNLQNIPIRTEIGREIRKAFIAPPGNLLISADYSQIELRILAHISRDSELVRAFRENQDIHTRTAARLFGVSPDQVTPEMRRQAKTVNFAVIYGMSEYGLSRELCIPSHLARAYIESYFHEYPGVRAYTDQILSVARERGFVESLLGRRRYIPEINSVNRVYREAGERAAVNMPIQATAADIVKIAMIRACSHLAQAGLSARLILQVHDELVFECPELEVAAVVPIVKDTMESAFPLDPPLKVEIKTGADWCNAVPIVQSE